MSSKDLIERIMDNDLVAAREVLGEELSVVREKKLYEVKRSLELVEGWSEAEVKKLAANASKHNPSERNLKLAGGTDTENSTPEKTAPVTQTKKKEPFDKNRKYSDAVSKRYLHMLKSKAVRDKAKNLNARSTYNRAFDKKDPNPPPDIPKTTKNPINPTKTPTPPEKNVDVAGGMSTSGQNKGKSLGAGARAAHSMGRIAKYVFKKANRARHTNLTGDGTKSSGGMSPERIASISQKADRVGAAVKSDVKKVGRVARKGVRGIANHLVGVMGAVEEGTALNRPTKTASELAKKYKIDPKKMKSLIDKGAKVEKEHTKNKDVAKEIARDHIGERPDYYKRLKKVDEVKNKNVVPPAGTTMNPLATYGLNESKKKKRNKEYENSVFAVNEVLSKNASAKDYIHDFVHSKNKTFKGHSKKLRIKQALAAYYKNKG
jgi:hypothetical protein